MERLIRTAILSVIVLLAGCRFEYPLTPGPSKNLNTWLLGVWENKEPDGATQRVTVTPKDSGRYWVTYQKLGRKGKLVANWQFDAWISRVGRANFLTLRMQDSGGQFAPGTHAFVHFQVLDQNHIQIRVPTLDSPPSTSGFHLRKEVREKTKSGTLYQNDGSRWARVSEVYWSGDNGPQPFQPLNYPEDPAGKTPEQ